MITNFKIFESLEERTTIAFTKWYNKYYKLKYNTTEEDQYFFGQRLKSWLLYKPYFEDKNILNYKSYEDYLVALDIAKEKYFSKLKNIKEGIDYEIIYKDDNVKVIVPLTLNGSCKYGYNTKWCTAMLESPHNFEKYKRDGELYRFIFNDDTKFSLHWANNGNKFFRDQLDNKLDPDSSVRGPLFVLSNAPFEIDKEALEEVSMDYIIRKWDTVFVKKWLKSKRIDSIEDYEKYMKNIDDY